MRENQSAAIVEKIGEWIVAESLQHTPKSVFGGALRYLGRQWVALTRFLTDPSLPLDNNVAERAVRVAALGRKNFLFVGHDEAGENLADLYTVISSASSIASIRFAISATCSSECRRIRSHASMMLLPWRWAEMFGSDSS